jgi:hypothetical protein
MAFIKGDYGIEYSPSRRDKAPLGLKLAVGGTILAVSISLLCTLISRVRSGGKVPAPTSAKDAVHSISSDNGGNQVRIQHRTIGSVRNSALDTAALPLNRPAAVRNLLLRLEEAEKARDLVVIVSTIEQIRALPGRPAADIDGRLAKRLGDLNAQWLFDYANAQWVKKVVVKPGDSAIRIAHESGSTLSSFLRLNGLVNAGRIKSGSVVKVMNHPRCNLVVSAKMADLYLNGKFFRRYETEPSYSAKPGVYNIESDARRVLASLGVSVKIKKLREELESLLPRGATVTVCDI